MASEPVLAIDNDAEREVTWLLTVIVVAVSRPHRCEPLSTVVPATRSVRAIDGGEDGDGT